ncbi:hypothetical protein [Arthrobacter sp. MYb213]|uniref:hypothetical protein n=1 Tax=Arthrobacter sp. MYb213 TaxID=1848595 RepID=UPI000CFAE552|nr:hypothetical protein [Arthrobacter sp. MYb213]PRB72737.1 hypothetical protein CQ011_03640 [Arthrobacter sp. MYb213]
MNIVHVWDSLDEFENAARGLIGIHSINLLNGNSVEIKINKAVFDSAYSSLIVLFGGAKKIKDEIAWPGRAFGSFLDEDLPVVAVADSTLKELTELQLGWYTGKPGDSFKDSLTDVFKSLQRMLDKEIIFAGGNGGGFAALEFGRKFKGRASVMTWDAHTDLYDAPPSLVKPFLGAVFGFSRVALEKPDWKKFSMYRTNGKIRTNIISLETLKSPRRLLCLHQITNPIARLNAENFWLGTTGKELTEGENRFGEDRILILADFQKESRGAYARTINNILRTFSRDLSTINIRNLSL